jgi:hypothetical protein
VHRQALEVRHRGVAGTEVVDGHLDPELVQPVQHLEGMGRVGHDGAFGDLHHQQPSGRVPAGQQAGDLVREPGVQQPSRRHVDGHRQLAPGLLPRPALAQCGIQDVVGQRADQPGPFGQGDELAGREQAMLRVLPAHQRLHPQYPAAVGVDLGLVVQHQLLAVDGAAQLAEQGQPSGAVLVELGVEQHEPGVGLLGGVHGDVGVLQQLVGSLPCSGYSATPMLASTSRLSPSSTNDPPRASCSFLTTTTAPSAEAIVGSRTANSSPPSRATVSTARNAPRSHSPTCTSSWSP